MQLKSALKDCSDAIRLRPDDPNYYNSRGLIELEIGAPAAAAEDYAEAITLAPSKASSIYGLGVAQEMLGEARAAAENIRRAEQLDTNVGVIFRRVGLHVRSE